VARLAVPNPGSPTPSPTPGNYVYLYLGQSLGIGRYGPIDPVLDATDDRIMQFGFDSQTLTLAADPLDHQDETANTVGPALSAMKALIAAGDLQAGRKLMIVPTCKGATGLGTGFWRPGGAGYVAAVARANAAMAQGTGVNVFKGIVWHGGEADQTVSQAQYEAYLDQMIAGLRADITGASATTPFVCAGMMPGGGQTGAGVAAALLATPNRVNRTAYSSSAGLTSGGDNIHIDAPSSRTSGQRDGAALITARSNNVAPHAPSAVPGLVATAVSGGQSVLTWNKPSDGGSPITDYLVEYRAQGSTPWLTFNDGVSTALTATITGLADGTVYETRVSGINAIGTGAPSATATTGTVTNMISNGNAVGGFSLTGMTPTNNVSGTADRLTEDTNQNTHGATSTAGSAVTAGQTYTVAFDFVYENLPYMQIHLPTALSNQAWANYDIQSLALGSQGAGVADVTVTSKSGGRVRGKMTFVAPVDGFAQCTVKGIASLTAARGATYVGTGRSVVVDNAQFVAGPDASFYP